MRIYFYGVNTHGLFNVFDYSRPASNSRLRTRLLKVVITPQLARIRCKDVDSKSVCDVGFWLVKAKFHYAFWSQTGPKLVADLQRAGIWPII